MCLLHTKGFNVQAGLSQSCWDLVVPVSDNVKSNSITALNNNAGEHLVMLVVHVPEQLKSVLTAPNTVI